MRLRCKISALEVRLAYMKKDGLENFLLCYTEEALAKAKAKLAYLEEK